MKRAALVLLTLTLCAAKPAAPKSESLAELTAKLKASPDDEALHARVIKLAEKTKAPVPEEAREPFIMGATYLKDSGDALQAFIQFDKAVQAAPWYKEAYFNRAVSRELMTRYEAAISDFEAYLRLYKLTEAEKREVKDKLYALKAKAVIHDQGYAQRVEDAHRGVIDEIKTIVAGRRYNNTPLSHSAAKPLAGANALELIEKFYVHGDNETYDLEWRFAGDRAELWSAASNTCWARGVSKGTNLFGMWWYNGCTDNRVWGSFDGKTGKLMISAGGHAVDRPADDAGYDAAKRYNYTRFAPL